MAEAVGILQPAPLVERGEVRRQAGEGRPERDCTRSECSGTLLSALEEIPNFGMR